MKRFSVAASVLLFAGCAVLQPYEELNLDTTSNFRKPTKGKAGIYVYQLKTGPLGAMADVTFEIRGYPEVPLNTGEYAYFEIDPGEHQYEQIGGGMLGNDASMTFKANENYFFQTELRTFTDHAYVVVTQNEVNAVKANILSGYYEEASVD
ncbi:MAG: hypothetical protein CME36_05895 [unclassified Hahellaceae]|nr:hypothetical protein [Hahellaceae bacterium]|tara:strand:- start:9386 stop:9838 length:453 start_codon:yes stop_codon:yes gene_type:complete